MGKAGAAGEKWKEKYDCALRTIEETNQMMKNLEHERDELHKEITSLKDDVNCLLEDHNRDAALKQNPQKSMNESTKQDNECNDETKQERSEQERNETECTATIDITKADSGIDIDLNEMKNELCQRMGTMIEEKIDEINLRRKRSDIINSCNSFNSSTIKTTNFGETGQMRDQNIIIHGVYEGNRDDREYVTKLFNILQMGHTGPLSVHRLGKKKCDRQRPLQVTMRRIEEKAEIMSKLGFLWGAEDEYRRISVTEDYTVAEREEIRRWVTLANEKSMNEESGYVWKARGTPRTGMRLIRIKQF